MPISFSHAKRMIDSLNFYNKEFEYKIYGRMPGAHVFSLIDSKEATEVRYLSYKFLERYLKPEKPFTSVGDVRKAGYRFN